MEEKDDSDRNGEGEDEGDMNVQETQVVSMDEEDENNDNADDAVGSHGGEDHNEEEPGEVSATQDRRADDEGRGNGISEDEDEDDEPIGPAKDRTRKGAAVVKSEEEEEDDDDDPEPVGATQSIKETTRSDEEEDVFEPGDGNVKEEQDQKEEEGEDEEEIEVENPKRKRKERDKYFENEAEVSGDDDSGDEEEEDEEAVDEYEDEDDEDDGERAMKRKKRRKKKRRRDDKLTEDEIRLIEENTGKKLDLGVDYDIDDEDDNEGRKRKKLKRLRKAKRKKGSENRFRAENMEALQHELFQEEDLDDVKEENGLNEDDQALDVEDRKSRAEDQFVVDEADDNNSDNFIEDDYDSKGEEMARIIELFGEGSKAFLRNQNPDDEIIEPTDMQDSKGLVHPTMRDIKYLSEIDDEIRRKDIPERYQERMRLKGTEKVPDEDDLFEEAKWINRHAFEDKMDTKVIVKILEFMKVDYFEIPVIFNTRREYSDLFLHLTNGDEAKSRRMKGYEDHLWKIDEWDERWDRMYSRRERLKSLAEEGGHLELKEILEQTCESFELNDVHDYIMTMSQNGSSMETKAPRRLQIINLVRDVGLDDLISVLSLTPKKFAENLYKNCMLNELPAQERAPEDLATEYVTRKLQSPEEVLARCRKIAAFRIFLHPHIRKYTRERCWLRARISTQPTLKGLREIIWTHKYYPYHRLMRKPATEFKGCDFVYIKKAEEEGFLKVTVEIEGCVTQEKIEPGGVPDYDFLLDDLQSFFFDAEREEGHLGWKKQRRLLLWELIRRHLFRFGTRYVKEKLLEEAQEQVARESVIRLRHLLETGKIRGDKSRVVICCVGDYNEPAIAVALSENGELLDQCELKHIKSRATAKSRGPHGNDEYANKVNEMEKFINFVERASPKAVFVAADSMQCRNFKREINQHLFNIDLEAFYLDPEIGRVYARTERSQVEFKEQHPLVRQAISLGRWVQDPASELAGMMVRNSQTKQYDIMSLDLHKMQRYIPASKLMPKINREFVKYVCFYGVDVNQILNHPHKKHTLQFIAGLGPRKSTKLYSDMKRIGQVTDRSQLSPQVESENRYEDDEYERPRKILGHTVYHNCAAFIKVVVPHENEEDDEIPINPLDQTRIHPEDYTLAEEIVRDVTEDDYDEDDEKEERKLTTSDYDKVRRNAHMLQHLDLEEFSAVLEKENPDDPYKKKLRRLELIVSELTNPFADLKPEGMCGFCARSRVDFSLEPCLHTMCQKCIPHLKDRRCPDCTKPVQLVKGICRQCNKVKADFTLEPCGDQFCKKCVNSDFCPACSQGVSSIRGLCDSCNKEKAAYTLQPCMHSACYGCAAKLKQDEKQRKATCPRCSKQVNNFTPEEEPVPLFEFKGRRRLAAPEGQEVFFESPRVKDLFFLLTGETEDTLRVGMLVTTQFNRIFQKQSRDREFNGGMLPRVDVRLESGIQGRIQMENVSDEAPTNMDNQEALRWLRQRVHRGMVIPARVRFINYEYIFVDLTSCKRDLENTTEFEQRHDILDPYLNKSGPSEDERRTLMKDQKAGKVRRRFKPRNVSHPLFKNCSSEEATEFLKQNYPEEKVIIRPSSKGNNHLTLTTKMGELIMHMDIEERNKPDPSSLGTVLVLNGKKYEELDEIIARYIEPLESKMQEMSGHKKFVEIEEGGPTVEEMLREQKNREPRRIPYCFSYSEKYPGLIEVSFIPSSSVKKEIIKVTPSGFRYRSTNFSSVNKLLAFFKKYAHKPPRRKSSSRKWRRGDTVEARYKQDNRWYPAKVMGNGNIPRTYQIIFEGYPEFHDLFPEDIRPRQ